MDKAQKRAKARDLFINNAFSYNTLKFLNGAHIDNCKRISFYLKNISGVREENFPLLENLIHKNQAGLAGLDDTLDDLSLGLEEKAFNLTAAALSPREITRTLLLKASEGSADADAYRRALAYHNREFYDLAGTMETIKQHWESFQRAESILEEVACEADIMNDRAFHVRTSTAFMPIVKPDASEQEVSLFGDLLVQVRSMELMLKDIAVDIEKDMKNKSLNILLEFATKHHRRAQIIRRVMATCKTIEARFESLAVRMKNKDYAPAIRLMRSDLQANHNLIIETLEELRRNHLFWLKIKSVHFVYNISKRFNGKDK